MTTLKNKSIQNPSFYKAVSAIAIPIALQSLIQTSLSMIDQMMVARLGSSAMAAAGLGSRPFTILFFLLLGVTGGVGIFAAQYWGNKEPDKFPDLMQLGFHTGLIVVAFVQLPSLLGARPIMKLFTTDSEVISLGAGYMVILSFSFLPMLLIMLYSSVLKSADIVKLPVFAGFISVLFNTLLNYLFIFGHGGFPQLGVNGAALATVLARIIECAVLIGMVQYRNLPAKVTLRKLITLNRHPILEKEFIKMTFPLLLGELVFVSSITFYAALYGRMGTQEMAAMTVLFPLQGITFGLFSGLSTAAAVLLGQHLGAGNLLIARNYAFRFLKLGFLFTVVLCLQFALILPIYLKWFNLEPSIYQIAWQLILTSLFFLPIQVTNMIIGDGVLRSGGQTTFLLKMTLVTLWGIGVPLGIYTAFILKLPLYLVFAAVSFEEIIRMGMGIYRTYSNKWLVQLT